jgi:hypothetical protein
MTSEEALASPDDSAATQEAVIATFLLSDTGWGAPEDYDALEELEERLMAAIAEHGVGEFDGMGRGMGVLEIFMYGASADALWAVVEPILRDFPANPGSFAVRRYGEPGAPEVRIDL